VSPRILAHTRQMGARPVTALFADIKGSMELMEDLDPEEALTMDHISDLRYVMAVAQLRSHLARLKSIGM
jgi:class 3 adenylate cyclase